MCGRYAVTLPPEAMGRLFRVTERPNLIPRWNVAPTQTVPMIAIGKDLGPHLVQARWGLQPGWMEKDPPTGPLFNARGETVADKPAFRGAFARKRCLVPADGYYEWKNEGGIKQPYFVRRRDGLPMVFAGLWESRKAPEGYPLVSTAIITFAAPMVMKQLHERTPVMMPEEAWPLWLAWDSPREALLPLIKAPPEEMLTWHAVSDRVNKVANDDGGLVQPISAP